MSLKLDPYGNCPQCEKSWDGGDILEEMKKLEIYFGRTDAYIEKKAESYYGYSQTHKRRFSHLMTNRLPHSSLAHYTCPYCKSTFEESSKTNSIIVYKNIYDARNKAATPVRVISEEPE